MRLQYRNETQRYTTPVEHWEAYEPPISTSLAPPDQQKYDLSQRIEAHLANPSETFTWEEVKHRIKMQYGLKDEACVAL